MIMKRKTNTPWVLALALALVLAGASVAGWTSFTPQESGTVLANCEEDDDDDTDEGGGGGDADRMPSTLVFRA